MYPRNYNRQYHREEQGVVADYVVIMGYDEHYGGSPVAGSVASYDFVKAGIENTLADVPAEKVINGVPFFTRVWEETAQDGGGDRGGPGHRRGGVHMNVTSTAYGMAEARSVGGAGRRPRSPGRDDAAELCHMGGERRHL